MEKNVIELNIGLENNPMDFDQIVKHFGLNEEMGAFLIREVEGQWNGNPERTVYIRMHNTFIYSHNVQIVERLCKLMNQTAIAMKINGQGLLVYNQSYQGPMHSFTGKYWREYVEVKTLHQGKFKLID